MVISSRARCIASPCPKKGMRPSWPYIYISESAPSPAEVFFQRVPSARGYNPEAFDSTQVAWRRKDRGARPESPKRLDQRYLLRQRPRVRNRGSTGSFRMVVGVLLGFVGPPLRKKSWRCGHIKLWSSVLVLCWPRAPVH